MASNGCRVLFLWWGRRGAMSRFTLDLAKAALAHPGLDPSISVSRSTERFAAFEALGDSLVPVTTFTSGRGAIAQLWRVPLLRASIKEALMERRIQAVVVLMSHVWNPLIASAVSACGVPYIVVVHDARRHPGDRAGRAHNWLMRDLSHADEVVTLSHTVGQELIARRHVDPARLHVLFHPDMGPPEPRRMKRAKSLRVLFFGRIMGYKGLSLFVEAVEKLHARGIAVEASVVGEGALGGQRERLERLNATVRNSWVDDLEIPGIFQRADVVVLSYTEASQSGVAALAFGCGVPVVATPVGGLSEQIMHGRTGLLAERPDADAIADALQRLALEPELLGQLAAGIRETHKERSMDRFLSELASISVGAMSRLRALAEVA